MYYKNKVLFNLIRDQKRGDVFSSEAINKVLLDFNVILVERLLYEKYWRVRFVYHNPPLRYDCTAKSLYYL